MFWQIKTWLGLEAKSTGIALSDPAALALFGGSPTAAGITVGPETAMRNSVVFCSVKIIAETLAQLTPHLYRKKGEDDRERATDHPVYPLVTRAANPWTPASEFRLVLGGHLAALGNAYAFVNRDGAGRVVELIPLDARSVSVSQDATTLQPVYRLATGDKSQREFGRDEILHIRGPGLSVYQGASPIHAGREAIGLALTIERHAGALFGRGAKPSGIIRLKKKVTEEIIKKLRASFSNVYSGTDGEKTAFLKKTKNFSSSRSVPLTLRRLRCGAFRSRKSAGFGAFRFIC